MLITRHSSGITIDLRPLAFERLVNFTSSMITIAVFFGAYESGENTSFRILGRSLSSLSLVNRVPLFLIVQVAILLTCRMAAKWVWKREFARESAVTIALLALAFGILSGWASVLALTSFFVHFGGTERTLFATVILVLWGTTITVVGGTIATYSRNHLLKPWQ